MINILLADDELLFRQGLTSLLEGAPNIKVSFQAESGGQALSIIQKVKPPVTLINILITDLIGLEILKKMSCYTRLIVLLKNYHKGLVARSLRLGAFGILTKNNSFSEVVQAIETAYADGHYLPQGLAQRILFDRLKDDLSCESLLGQLSHREFQIMLMIVSGYSVQYISSKLFLSSKTVNTYRYRIFEKCSLHNDVELTHLAWAEGIFLPNPVLRSTIN